MGNSPSTQTHEHTSHKHTHTTPSTVYTVYDVAKSLLEGERIQVKVNHKGVIFHITTTYRIDYLLSINGGCIDVTIGDAFYITSYYYKKKMEDCPSIHHDVILSFLKQLAYLLEYSIVVLDDTSTKTFHPGSSSSCKIPHYFFSWSGKKTFYEQKGFENREYTEYIERTSSQKVKEYLGEHHYQELCRIFLSPIDLESVTMRELAHFIIENCKSTTEYTNIVRRATQYISEHRGIGKAFRFVSPSEPPSGTRGDRKKKSTKKRRSRKN